MCDQEARYVIPIKLIFFHLQSEKAHRSVMFRSYEIIHVKPLLDLSLGHSKYQESLDTRLSHH